MLASRQPGISTTAHCILAKRLPLSCLLVAAIALQAACVEPSVRMKRPAVQEKAVTVHDWDWVAHRISARMQQQGLLASDPSGRSPLFYVNMVAKESPFLHEVRDALEGDLRARNVSVARSPSGATAINIDASFVQWSHGDVGPGGAGTLLGAGIASGCLIADANRAGPTLIGLGGIALASGIAFDVLAATLQTTNTEVIWQALIVSADRVLMRIHEPMYVTASDATLYFGRSTAAIVSPGPMVALESVPVRYQQ